MIPLNYSRRLLVMAFSSCILLTACTKSDQASQPSTQVPAQQQAEASSIKAQSQELKDYLQAMDLEDMQRSPLFASYRGEKIGYDKWDNISEAYANETLAVWLRRLEELKQFDANTLASNDALSLKIAQLNTSRAIKGDKFRHNNYVMQQFRAWHTVVPSMLINIHRVNSEQELKDYIARVQKVGVLFDQVVEQMRLRAKLGVFPPKWTYPQMLEASKNVIVGAPFEKGDDSTILKDFKNKLSALSLDNSVSQKYLSEVEAALLSSVKPAYEKLIKELQLQQDIAPEGDGVWRLPNGKDYYNYLLQFYTTTNLNAEQVHQLGLDNVARIHQEMRDIMAKVKFKGELQDFFAFMRDDNQFYYPETDDGRNAYLTEATNLVDTIRKKLPEYFGILPKADMVVKRVEPFRERSAGKAFYQAPSADGSRAGIYYANLFRISSMPKYQMEALAYHEGIPGHHMQRAITVELKDIPNFQKYVSFTAFTEGWGLYSEYLPKEMGFYQDPYSDFGRLAMELWRACRLVVDTGIHAKKWSREEAIKYLQDNTPNPAEDTVKAIERYIVYPGQATAYLIGKIKILELREHAKAELGDKFDIRGFHDEVLKDGPVPLSLLEEKIDRWIENEKKL